MRALAVEKLEPRKTAAADLVVSLDSMAGGSESVTEEQICRPLARPIYEQVDSNIESLDVDRDGYITPTDAQLVVDQMNADRISTEFAQGPLVEVSGEQSAERTFQYDVNQDGVVTPGDALIVLNRVHFYNSLVPCTCTACLANAIVDGV